MAVTILYGSQTGNAQSIAEDLCADCNARDIPATVHEMNAFKKFDVPLEQHNVLVFICSTTGNGDAPSNADRCWRYIKKRSQPKDLMANVNYTVLGLGDTNYEKFCYMGKSLDKRMGELGGKCFYGLGCADEGTGLEDVVEPWLDGFFPALEALRAGSSSSESDGQSDDDGAAADSVAPEDAAPAAPAAGGGKPLPPPSDADLFAEGLSTQALSLLDEQLSRRALEEARVPALAQLLASAGVAAAEAPKDADLPRLAAAPDRLRVRDPADGGSLAAEAAASAWTCANGSDSASPTLERPFLGGLCGARYLTRAADASGAYAFGERRVIHVEVDVSGSEAMGSYQPGDAVGVVAPNDEALVRCALARLRAVHGALAHASVEGPAEDDLWAAGCSLAHALRWRVDLQSAPRKKLLRQLAEHCGAAEERAAMLALCAKGAAGSAAYDAVVAAKGLRVGELFALFRSLAPPPAELLALLPKQLPRFYSVASSPLQYATAGEEPRAAAKRLSVALSVVEYELDGGLRRRGLCSTYLERSCAAFLGGAGAPAATVALFAHPARDFVLPAHMKWPLVMVGPGTGVAPFMGFLAHRKLERVRKQEACALASMGYWRGGVELSGVLEQDSVAEFTSGGGLGEAHLYFGCRHRERDWIYREEMEAFKADGTLSALRTAFSRDANVEDGAAGDGAELPHKYVTHLLRQDRETIARLLRCEGAYLFICGDGTSMAQDVLDALVDCLMSDFTAKGAALNSNLSANELASLSAVEGAVGAAAAQEEQVTEGLSREDARRVLEDLSRRGRLVQDVWS